MGRQIRADLERNTPDRIATDIKMQRTILLADCAFVAVSLLLGHWMIGLTALLAGLAFLIPYWRNRPLDTADVSRFD
jgi:Flp pilus assembly protein TadB